MGQTCECNGEPQDADGPQSERLMRDGVDDDDGEIVIDDYAFDVDEDVKVGDKGDDPVEIPPINKDDPPDQGEEFKREESKDGEDAGPFDMLIEISTSPTIQAQKVYVTRDVTSIHNLITKMRPQEIKKGLVNLLCCRSMAQRVRIRQAYQEQFSNLPEEITAMKKGKTRQLLMQLLRTPAELMAVQLLQAMKDMSMRDVALIIVILTNHQIADLRDAFPQEDPERRSLTDAVLNFCKDDHMKLLMSNLLQCEEFRLEEPTEDVDETKATDDAERIKTALEVARQSDIDVQTIVEILSTRSWNHICKIAEKYTTVSDDYRALFEAMEKKGFKNIDVGIACHALVQVATDRHGYFAQQLSETAGGVFGGIDYDAVALLIMYRCEIDLGDIIQTFSESEAYGGSNVTFQMWLERKITGTFGYALSLLCGLADPDVMVEEPEPGAATSPSGSADAGQGIPLMNEICTYSDFAFFCDKKIGEKARLSLWRKVDKNGDGVVDASELKDLLIYTAVVYYTHKLKKEHGITVLDDKMRRGAPDFVEPITSWILANKLSDGSIQLTQQNFVQHEVEWIREYADYAEQPQP